jgi:hypothetical protein
MAQPIQVLPTSPSTSPAHIHNCRWDWCRLTFPTNALLIDHVIHTHVRKAEPVRRRDLPMLMRTEEGLGDSLRFSDGTGELVISSASLSLLVPRTACLNRVVSTSYAFISTGSVQTPFASGTNMQASMSPRPPRSSKRARTESQSHSELPSVAQDYSQFQPDLPTADTVNPTPHTPLISHASTSPALHTNPNVSPPSPRPNPSPTQSPLYSPSQASPGGSPSDSIRVSGSQPASPSFNSHVAKAVRALTSGFPFGFRGGRGREVTPPENRDQAQVNASPSPTSPRKRKARPVSLQCVFTSV